jgi:hypothetical protein
MRYIIFMWLACLLMLNAAEPSKQPNPQLLTDPLTSEEIAIYREVLQYSMKKDQVLYVANKTAPRNQSDIFPECFAKINPRKTGMEFKLNEFQFIYPMSIHTQSIHTLDASVTSNLGAVLVDPDKQQKLMEEIAKLLRNKTKFSKQVFNRKLHDLDKQSIQSIHAGLFTLSEILFDKERQYAFVVYTFDCGGLCGGGSTYILKKENGMWKISTTCGTWMS